MLQILKYCFHPFDNVTGTHTIDNKMASRFGQTDQHQVIVGRHEHIGTQYYELVWIECTYEQIGQFRYVSVRTQVEYVNALVNRTLFAVDICRVLIGEYDNIEIVQGENHIVRLDEYITVVRIA
jgi:hypothetical protein